MNNSNFRIAVWGVGFIGFSSMVYFSRNHIKCYGIDTNPAVEKQILSGTYKQDMVSWLNGNPYKLFQEGKCKMCVPDDLPKDDCELVHLICVPTEKNCEPTMRAVLDTVAAICTLEQQSARTTVTVIIESTMVPGTAKRCLKILAEHLPDKKIQFGVAPRRDWFISRDKDLANLPRVYGANSQQAHQYIGRILSTVCKELVEASDYEHAEMVKSVENAFRHMGIALANQLSDAFPQMNIRHVLALAGTKWNVDTYYPSFGVGGYCVPLSSRYIQAACGNGVPLLESTIHYDNQRPFEIAAGIISDNVKHVGILGLGYKEDLSVESNWPIISIIRHLRANSVKVSIHDPWFSEEYLLHQYGTPRFDCFDYQAYEQFDVLIVSTAHSQYQMLDCNALMEGLRNCRYVLDNTGLFQKIDIAESLGGRYRLVGLPRKKECEQYPV